MTMNNQQIWLKEAVDQGKIKFIQFDTFSNIQVIAPGSFGKVSRAYWSIGEKNVSLKSLDNEYNSGDQHFYQELIKELRIAREVDFHDAINRFFGVSRGKSLNVITDSANRYYLVLEYANGGNLRDFLRNNIASLDWTKKIDISKQIARGLRCLHSQNIVHRDLVGYRESPVVGTPSAFAETYSKAWDHYEEKRPTIQQACDELDEINLLPTFDSHPSPPSLFSYESSTGNSENLMTPVIIRNRQTTIVTVDAGSSNVEKNLWLASVDVDTINTISAMTSGVDKSLKPTSTAVKRKSKPTNADRNIKTINIDRSAKPTNVDKIVDKRVEDRRILMSQKLQKPKTKDAQRQRAAYPISKKEEVVEYAKKYSRNAAARHYGLDAPMVGRWVKASEKWNKDTDKNVMRLGSGRRAFFPEAEDRLYQWIVEQRNTAVSMTYAMIRKQMLEILKEPDMAALYTNADQFKARSRWLTAFMKRKKIALKRRNKFSHKLPEQLRASLDKFRHDIFQLRYALPFEMYNILNMCETPVWFDMAGNFAVNPIGEKNNHGNRSNNDKNRFTVVLTCAADGSKYPPICIFKGRQLPRGEVVPPGVFVCFQEDDWMTGELMNYYVNYLIQIRTIQNQSNMSALMVYDPFRGHLDDSIQRKFYDNNIRLVMIPPGLKSVCQPLDVVLNKPFIDNLRKEWYQWMVGGGTSYNSTRNLRLAKFSDVCGWVKRSWDEISPDYISRSFKKCAISNALDGSENDMVYDDIEEIAKELQKEKELEDLVNGEDEYEIIDLNDDDENNTEDIIPVEDNEQENEDEDEFEEGRVGEELYF
ncbi:8923_t:CDS:2 [Acaulospora morrowiae]|uniref:8923_t:CDS:1 n=1 Tax=Acaulospora morrowiae TaxID=94023 RepID=A0A9N8ZWN4_9GLOM|nr:8923_t:CDS:2 [Acaulospora morrowiae]